ncbi:MAG TPA: ABC transporter ATP-binding protein [Oscillatoriaceae cyanobacterium M33_DOE_052]|uniref:ABC transporter ATP-binding protein n=1 Tax=Planktothricoides sp. SpSt-374 TaxID=2282167 RepID=A0A7C3VJQ7_9CYAN|nr:ABC transporter ATP-binding protein [Oscillatoriaceae cyanobacterium M33_DOE_052]
MAKYSNPFPGLKLEGISRQFQNVNAISDITFEVGDGQFWVLVGPSGCGKSTILRIIAGLESATSGNLYIDGLLVNNLPARARDVAMVFQNYALYPHMTVAENLGFGLKMRGVQRQEIALRVGAVARSLRLEHLLARKPQQLSGGQQQRVALGRAIVRQPKVFLLDEPLSNLDAQLREDTRAELKQLHASVGITTVYVTHDQVEAMTLADRIVVLNEGRIQQIGSPQTIYREPANRMVATFIGNPPMNILPVTYSEGGFHLHSQTIPCPETLAKQWQLSPEQHFYLGIRPEHLQILPDSDAEAHLVLQVNVVEPLGRETLIRASFPGADTLINILAPADWDQSPRVAAQLDLQHLHRFQG